MDSKAIIGNAMEEVLDEEFAEYINTLPIYADHQFSERHNRKMNKLIRIQRKPYFSLISTAGRRAACIIVTSSLSISGKKASCVSIVHGFSGLATKVVITQTLQKQNGSTWTYVSSWNKTFNTWLGSLSNSKSSLSSGTYRLKTVAKVYSGNNYETITVYSSTASC